MVTKVTCRFLLKSWILTAMDSASLIRRVSGIYLYDINDYNTIEDVQK